MEMVMVWGCIAATGVANLVFIEGSMDRRVYLEPLKTNLRISAEKLHLRNRRLFQQVPDSKPTSAIVKGWLLFNVTKKLNPTPQSPDMNSI
ncbi:hypothetical protein Trydic_g988 [Trypoxylus dichotomus]